ncbi:MAG: GyrI-like domain-containing protein [Flavobacteriales bacterium]
MITKPELVNTSEVPSAAIHLTIPGRDMPKYMDPAVNDIIKTLTDQGTQPSGPMFSYHYRRPSDTFDFEIGFPVAMAIQPAGRVMNSKLPAVKVARAVYEGPYEGLAEAWGALQKWVREQKLAETGRFWERYLTNPAEVTDPKKYRTELNWVISA